MQTIQTPNNTFSVGTVSINVMSGIFRVQERAEKAIEELERRGYKNEDVNVLMSEETRHHLVSRKAPTQSSGAKAAEGAGMGSAVGGVAGAIVAGFIAVAAPILLPGIGLIVSGPIVAALAGAGAGGLAGGLVGSLVGLGIPEHHARIYDLGLRQGGVLVTVQPRTVHDADAIAKEWTKLGAEHVRA